MRPCRTPPTWRRRSRVSRPLTSTPRVSTRSSAMRRRSRLCSSPPSIPVRSPLRSPRSPLCSRHPRCGRGASSRVERVGVGRYRARRDRHHRRVNSLTPARLPTRSAPPFRHVRKGGALFCVRARAASSARSGGHNPALSAPNSACSVVYPSPTVSCCTRPSRENPVRSR